MARKQTPEQAERDRVRRNVWGKTFATAAIVSILAYLTTFSSCRPEHHTSSNAVAQTFYNVNASIDTLGTVVLSAVFAAVAFCFTVVVGGALFARYENGKSQKRLAQLAQIKRMAQQQAEVEQQQLEAQQEQKRLEAIRQEAERERLALLEQKLRDSREYVLTKLNAAGNNINLYDSSANFDTRARVMQAVDNELFDVNVNHTRSELMDLIERYPEVRGMIVALGERLQAKGIDSHQAAQILAALT